MKEDTNTSSPKFREEVYLSTQLQILFSPLYVITRNEFLIAKHSFVKPRMFNAGKRD